MVDGVGLTTVILRQDEEICKYEGKLQKNNSVFQAELWAICRAVYKISDLAKEGDSIVLFSDSQAALRAISTFVHQNIAAWA